MATNDDLDDFFKKKDRKGNKHKKQTGLLTNNEELLKQLVIVTSATSAFKENIDFDDEADEQQINDEPIVASGYVEDTHKHPAQPNKTKNPDNNKFSNGQQINISEGGGQQQDEWEEFEDPNSKYEQLRLKFSRGNNENDDDDDEYYDDDNNPHNNDDNNNSNIDRDQQKDKPVWKINQIQQQQKTETDVPNVEEKIPEPTPPPKPSATSSAAYRPPQLRGAGSSSVTVVSGLNQRPTKKKEVNIASTDEFPTLGSTVKK
jgi:hypothetical protein